MKSLPVLRQRSATRSQCLKSFVSSHRLVKARVANSGTDEGRGGGTILVAVDAVYLDLGV